MVTVLELGASASEILADGANGTVLAVHANGLLLADEPTGELDQATGEQIVALLDRLHADGTAVVVVTHDPAVAGRAHRLLRMRDGRIVEESIQ